MSRIALYLDDDFAEKAVRAGPVRNGIEVAVSDAMGMRGAGDDRHLTLAHEIGAVLCSYNVRDFARIHQQWMNSERHHSGMLLVVQGAGHTGELIRRITRFADTFAAEDMIDRVEFLSQWGAERPKEE